MPKGEVAAAGDVLERDDELGRLAEVASSAAAGRGAAALVQAGAGLGKTTLLERCAADAPDGLRVLRARGGQVEAEIPLGVVRELLAPVVPEDHAEGQGVAAMGARLVLGHGVRLPPDAAMAVPHAISWLVADLAQEQPLLLLVDDAHQADELSLGALAYLSRRVDDLPVALVLAARPGPAAPPLLDDLAAHPDTEVLVPGPLSAAASRELVQRLAGDEATDAFADACHRACGGNPQLVGELARGGAGATPADVGDLVPDTVRRATVARIAELGDTAVRLTRAVAVLERAGPAVAARVAELEPAEATEAADALVAAEVLAAELPLALRHPLLRAAVLDDISPPVLEHLHRRAATALAGIGDDERAAAHLLATAPAGDDDAATLLARAAATAAGRGDPRTAVRLLERAVRERPPAPGTLAALGRAQLLTGDLAGRDHLRRALEQTPDPAARAPLVATLAAAEQTGGDVDLALELVREELARAEPGSPEEGVLLTGYLGLAHGEHADDARRRVVRRLGLLGDRRPDVGTGAAATLMAFVGGEPVAEVAGLARRVLAAPDALAWAGAGPPPFTQAAWCLAGCDAFDDADEALGRLMETAREMGSHLLMELAADTRLYSRWRRGDLLGAQADAERVIELSALGWEHPIVPARWALTDLLLDRGRRDEAREAFAPIAGLAADPPPSIVAGWALGAQSRLLLDEDPEGALAAAVRAGEVMDALGAVNPAVLPWASLGAQAALALGDADRARELADDELRRAEAFGAALTVAIARRSRALAAEGEERLARLEEAAAGLEGSPARLERARILCELGRARRRANALPAARDALREALHLAAACGADALLERAREELRAARGRLRRPVGAAPAGLTPRELELCRMAAAGRSNREIAESLFLTVKTVETHLGSAYRKLDVPGRSGLGEALDRATRELAA